MSLMAVDPLAGTSSIDISESSPRPSALRLIAIWVEEGLFMFLDDFASELLVACGSA